MSDNTEKPYRPNVGIMVTNTDGKILIGLRNDVANAWQMPQGGIENGEDVVAAAGRELGEETGIAPALVEFIGKTSDWLYYDYPESTPEIYKKRHRGQKQLWVHFKFKGNDTDINPDTAEPEFTAFKWAEPKEVISLIAPFKRHIYEMAIAELLG